MWYRAALWLDMLFDIPSYLDQFVWRICLRNMFHVLFDNGGFIKITGHVMSRGVIQFCPLLECLVMGPPFLETTQKGMTDTDASS